MTIEQFWAAMAMTLLASLTTAVGGALVLVQRRPGPKFLAVTLGFSAGVMIYVSLAQLLATATTKFYEAHFSHPALFTIGAFMIGIITAALVDKLLPHSHHPDAAYDAPKTPPAGRMMRISWFVGLALSLHNFPEGFVTFVANLDSPQLGIPVAVAIALHNIPEGIAVAVPIYFATQNRWLAFAVAAMSGMAEPIGAAVGGTILWSVMGPAVLATSFAVIAGIMVFISLDQLFPAAREYGEHHLAIYGLFAGMAVLGTSLALM